MKYTVTGIGVDAGMIIVADMDYLNRVPSPEKKEIKRLGKVIQVPNGSYKVNWFIPDTGNGDISGQQELEVTSGKVMVIDPCYCIGKEGNDWGDWLDATDFGANVNDDQAFIIDEMGGDGEYEVELNFIKK